jgi:hypothetical protein
LSWSRMAGAGLSRTRISGFLFWRQLVSPRECDSFNAFQIFDDL